MVGDGIFNVCFFLLFCSHYHPCLGNLKLASPSQSPKFSLEVVFVSETQKLWECAQESPNSLIHQAQVGEEIQRGGAAPARGQQRGGLPRGPYSRSLHFGSQGPGPGRTFPACSVLPNASLPPRGGIPKGVGTACYSPPGRYSPSTPCSGGQREHVRARASGSCVHTCSKARWLGRSLPGTITGSPVGHSAHRRPGITVTHGRVPPLPQALQKVQETLMPHPSGQRRARGAVAEAGRKAAQPGR